MKTNELVSTQLDWAVAKAEGRKIESPNGGVYWPELCYFSPSTTWMQCGEIIGREGIRLHRSTNGIWFASMEQTPHQPISGETPLIAVCRCYVFSVFGTDIDIPEEIKP